jgi:hypothetical protein
VWVVGARRFVSALTEDAFSDCGREHVGGAEGPVGADRAW